MKFVFSILMCSATAAIACGTVSGSSSGFGSSSVQSNAGTSAVANGAGSSYSFATNAQDAATSISTYGGGSHDGKKENAYIGGSASVQGYGVTSGSSMAYNISSGSGTGTADASGLSHARAEGQASFEGRNLYGKISGNATGHANSVTGDGVSARTNQGDVAGGSSSTSFQQNASASLRGQSCDDCVRSVQQNASTLSNSFAVNTSYTGAVMNDSTPLNAAVTNMNITAKAGGDASSKSWALKQ
jgi:hypothetical protein